MLIPSHWLAKLAYQIFFLNCVPWKVQVSWRVEGGLGTHPRLTPLQVGYPSKQIPAGSPALPEWPYLQAGSHTREPGLAPGHLSLQPTRSQSLLGVQGTSLFPRSCHVLCTPTNPHKLGGMCMSPYVTQWGDSCAVGSSVQLLPSLPLFLPPSLPLLFIHTFMGHLLGVSAVLDPQDTNMKNSFNNKW